MNQQTQTGTVRRNLDSGSSWEASIGYSRAVVVGNMVFTSATAASGIDGKLLGIGDMYQQTRVILEKLGAVLQAAGASYRDVVQSKLYLTDISLWREAGRAHGEVFGDIRPALTMLHVKPFLDPDMLLEIELVAIRTG